MKEIFHLQLLVFVLTLTNVEAPKSNKTFKKRKNRALLTLRPAHRNTTKYLATTFCEKNLPGNT